MKRLGKTFAFVLASMISMIIWVHLQQYPQGLDAVPVALMPRKEKTDQLAPWLAHKLAEIHTHTLIFENIWVNSNSWNLLTPRKLTPAPKALLYLGWLAYNPNMAMEATTGGPTGEFVLCQ